MHQFSKIIGAYLGPNKELVQSHYLADLKLFDAPN